MDVFLHPDECHDGTFEYFEKFRVKVYTGVKFEICVNRVKLVPIYSSSHMDSENKYFYLLPMYLTDEKGKGQGLISTWVESLKFIRFGLNSFKLFVSQ